MVTSRECLLIPRLLRTFVTRLIPGKGANVAFIPLLPGVPHGGRHLAARSATPSRSRWHSGIAPTSKLVGKRGGELKDAVVRGTHDAVPTTELDKIPAAGSTAIYCFERKLKQNSYKLFKVRFCPSLSSLSLAT